MGALAIIDDKKYARVLSKILPRVIASAVEYDRMLAEVEKFMNKGDRRTVEDDAALELMVRLIQDYEKINHPLTDPSPQQMLLYLMEKRGLRQADLVPILGSSGYVSDVVNGKRGISKAHAKELAVFFGVSPGLFL